MKRRDFLINSGLAIGALAILPSMAFGADKRNIGIQLYSLRNIFEKDVKGVLKKIAKAGYKEVECYGFSLEKGFFGITPKDFRAMLDDNGLVCPSGHYDTNPLLRYYSMDLFNASLECANILGNTYYVTPYIDESVRNSEDDYKRTSLKMNEAALLCKNAGLKYAYHNHAFEFENLEKKTGYSILLKETDKKLVKFELDLYWAVRAGQDASKMLKENAKRFSMVHIKDMDKKDPKQNTEIGNGSIDFKKLLTSANLANIEHLYVEQENNYYPNEIESIQTSLNYINQNLI